jgi:dTDP-4-dehydrorhamnose reductase
VSDPVWLVTGAGGQLGRSLRAVAPSLGVRAVALDRAALDVCDAGAIDRALAELRPDVVLNAAAYTQVDHAEQDAREAWRVNGEAPGRLAALCRGRALLIHVSTEYVFAGDRPEPLDEEAPTGPLSCYGRTKLAGERAVRAAAGEHLIVRTQWLFGPGANFVRTMLRLAREGPLRVVEDQIGRPTWTIELAGAILRAERLGLRGTLHLACEGVASWYDFACAIVEGGARLGLCPEVQVTPVGTVAFPRPAPRPRMAVLGLERARAAGIRLPHWRHALERYLSAEKEAVDA